MKPKRKRPFHFYTEDDDTDYAGIGTFCEEFSAYIPSGEDIVARVEEEGFIRQLDCPPAPLTTVIPPPRGYEECGHTKPYELYDTADEYVDDLCRCFSLDRSTITPDTITNPAIARKKKGPGNTTRYARTRWVDRAFEKRERERAREKEKRAEQAEIIERYKREIALEQTRHELRLSIYEDLRIKEQRHAAIPTAPLPVIEPVAVRGDKLWCTLDMTEECSGTGPDRKGKKPCDPHCKYYDDHLYWLGLIGQQNKTK